MPRLMRDLPGAQPVDRHGNATAPSVTLHAGAEFVFTIRKLRKADDSFDEFWCEISTGEQLYRVPLRLLDTAIAA